MKSRQDQAPTWGVVSLCDEPLPLLEAYVAHYAAMGASKIYLFLDKPSTEVAEAFSNVPQCTVIQCTRRFWKGAHHSGRPSSSQLRQLVVTDIVYRKAEVDWLAHVDLDEFLSGAENMANLLATTPPDTDFLQFQTIERVTKADVKQRGLFDGIYRHPLPEDVDDRTIYGSDAKYLRDGVTGHPLTKSIVRTGLPLLMGVHTPRPLRTYTMTGRLSGAFQVLHFDGLTAMHWVFKLLRYCQSPRDLRRKRKGPPYKFAQMQYVMQHYDSDITAIFALHDRLKVLDHRVLKTLRNRGLLDERHFDPAADAVALDLPNPPDLNVEAFDAALLQKNPAFAQKIEQPAPLRVPLRA